jgi:hypothetical protein
LKSLMLRVLAGFEAVKLVKSQFCGGFKFLDNFPVVDVAFQTICV